MASPSPVRKSPRPSPVKKSAKDFFYLNPDLVVAVGWFVDPITFRSLAFASKALYKQLSAMAQTKGLSYHLELEHSTVCESLRVLHIAVSLDGRWIALDDRATSPQAVQMYNQQSKNSYSMQSLDIFGCICDLTLNGDGAVLAQCNGFGAVEVWDTTQGATHRLAEIDTMNADVGPCASLCRLTANGKTCVTAGSDQNARVWTVATGALCMTLPPTIHKIQSLCISSNASFIGTGGGNGWNKSEIKLWCNTQKKLICTQQVSDGVL
jgi:WD40 repeat protein